MFIFGSEKIDNISTEAGNRLIRRLKEAGWRISHEYQGWDKGIDFDSYSLKFSGNRLKLTWDNWMGWEVSGNKNSITVARRFLSEVREAPIR